MWFNKHLRDCYEYGATVIRQILYNTWYLMLSYMSHIKRLISIPSKIEITSIVINCRWVDGYVCRLVSCVVGYIFSVCLECATSKQSKRVSRKKKNCGAHARNFLCSEITVIREKNARDKGTRAGHYAWLERITVCTAVPFSTFVFCFFFSSDS